MKPVIRFSIIGALVVGVAVVMIARSNRSESPVPAPGPEKAAAEQPAVTPPPLPQLLELGSTHCIPCRAMEPVLEELRHDYAGKLSVHFTDINVQKEAADRYGITIIPTQIFFDAQGEELFRHEGFFPKEEIVGKWRELGFDFGASGSAGS